MDLLSQLSIPGLLGPRYSIHTSYFKDRLEAQEQPLDFVRALFAISVLVHGVFHAEQRKGKVYMILYFTLLYYSILFYTILYYSILYYSILYYTILYYTILYYTILYCAVLYYTLSYALLYYTIPYYTTSYYMVSMTYAATKG